jgi:hypothetical protein
MDSAVIAKKKAKNNIRAKIPLDFARNQRFANTMPKKISTIPTIDAMRERINSAQYVLTICFTPNANNNLIVDADSLFPDGK